MRFLLVDRLHPTDDPMRLRGEKLVALAEDYLEHHFPEQPVYPGNLTLEACVQVAGWLEARASAFETWVALVAVDRARWTRLVGPGDRLQIEVARTDLRPADSGVRGTYTARCEVDGATTAQIDFDAVHVAVTDLMDPDTLRRRHASLCPTAAAGGSTP